MNPSVEAKERVLNDLANRNRLFLDLVRDEAARVAAASGSVTADDVRNFAESCPVQPTHRKAIGALFRDKRFVFLGEVVTTLVGTHGKKIGRWGLA